MWSHALTQSSKVFKEYLDHIAVTDEMSYTKEPVVEVKELLWQLSQQTSPLLIHCKAGIGRTGHLILTLELIKHYSEIFASNEPTKIAQFL